MNLDRSHTGDVSLNCQLALLQTLGLLRGCVDVLHEQ